MESFNPITPKSFILTPDKEHAFSLDEENEEWFYKTTFNCEIIEESTLCYLDCFDPEFIKQLTALSGNLYRQAFGSPYPEYVYGIIPELDNQTASLSRAIKGYMDFSEIFGLGTETDDSNNTTYKITIKDNKNLYGLMKVFALCIFFNDTDFRSMNLGWVASKEKFEAVKVDPEAAFGFDFFSQNSQDIIELLDISEVEDNLLELFIEELEEAILSDFIDLKDHPDEEELRDLIKTFILDLLYSEKFKEEFFSAFEEIIKNLEPTYKGLMFDTISPQYKDQIAKLMQAMNVRLNNFKSALMYYHNPANTEKEVTTNSNLLPHTIYQKAKATLYAGDRAGACRLLDFACQYPIAEKNYLNFILRADLKFSENKFDSALSDYSSVIANGYAQDITIEELSHCLLQRAKCYNTLGHFPLAITDLEKCLTINATATIYLELAKSYIQQENWQSAKENLKAATRIDPENKIVVDEAKQLLKNINFHPKRSFLSSSSSMLLSQKAASPSEEEGDKKPSSKRHKNL